MKTGIKVDETDKSVVGLLRSCGKMWISFHKNAVKKTDVVGLLR